MISVLTIILFFVYLWGLGFTISYFLKKPESMFERFFLNLAIGLGVFPILAILLNFLHVPLDWRVFLVLSVAFPLYIIGWKIKEKQLSSISQWFSLNFKFKLTKSDMMLVVVLLIFFFSLFMYTKGAFSYSYLEDEDPWGHAVGAKYVALEKTAYDPVFSHQKVIDFALSYIDPYPPAYDILMGVLHQTSVDLPWTLKFFNALLISLGLVFFYLFAQLFLGSRSKAVLATFFLAAVPAYFSHFIWAHSLVVVLFFPAMYALIMIKEDQKWFYAALIIVASIWVSQNIEEPIKLTVMMLVFVLVGSITAKRFMKKEFLAVIFGLLLSFIWWGTMIQKYTLRGFIRYFTGNNIVGADGSSLNVEIGYVTSATGKGGIFQKIGGILHSLTSSGGSASRAYSFHDFFVASSQNQINSPIGIGIVLSLLMLFGVFYMMWHYRSRLVEEEQMALSVMLLWLVYTFWGVNGQTFLLSIARGPFRMWLLLAIPVALIAAEGTFMLIGMLKKFKVPALIVLAVVVLGVLMTSGYQKYQLNTSIWPTSGAYSTPTEPVEYANWFSSIPFNTPVFLYAPRDKLVIGLGGNTCAWCEDVIDFRADIIHQDIPTLHSFLKNHGYHYLIANGAMDSRSFKKIFGENETNELLLKRYDEIQQSGLFKPVYYKKDLFVVFQVN